MTRQLSAIGLPFEIFDAINGAALSEEEREKVAPKAKCQNFTALTPGEIGCALSHLTLLRKIARGTDEFVAVLEDDAILAPSAPPFFTAEVLSTLPFFHVLTLCGTDNFPKRLKMTVAQFDGHAVRARRRAHSTTVGMIFTPAGARYILDKSGKTITAPIDSALFLNCHALGLRVLGVEPAVVRQNFDLPNTIPGRKPFSVGKTRREYMRLKYAVRRWVSFVRAWGLPALFQLRA